MASVLQPAPQLPELAPLSTAPVPHRRHLRNYIIDKRLQFRYIGAVSLLSAAISGLLGWLIWSQRNQASRTIERSLETVDWLPPEQKTEILHHLAGADLTVLLRMGLVCAGLIVVLSMFLLVMTHKVAGPLHMMSAAFDALGAGKLPVVHNLRRGDEFRVFHKKFSEMCNALRGRAEADAAVYESFLIACRAAAVELDGLDELERLAHEKVASLEPLE